MSTTTTGTTGNPGLGERIATALFAEVDSRKGQGGAAFSREALKLAFVGIIERECRDYVTGKPAKVAKPRNELLDAFATIGGGNLEEVTKTAWPGFAKRLAEIKEVSPDVTVEELHARAAAYQRKFPQATLTPHALAKHWGELGAVVKVEVVRDYTRI